MSKSASSQAPKVQKICTLWTHDDSLSREDVLFNIDRFPELAISPGSLVKIVALSQSTAVRDFQDLARTPSQDGSRRIKLDTVRKASSPSGFTSRKPQSGSFTLTLDENGHRVHGGRDVDPQKTYVFLAKAIGPDLKSKYPNLQVSVSDHIARNFGFRNRMQVMLSPAEDDLYSASHVEISFRDEYLSRADMWRFAISELSGKTVYKGQKLLFMGTIKATVKNVFVDGQTTHSAYFSTMTKPVFRSESARYVLFIQMAKEMWNFDTEGSGEIMFNKVINGFLPDLFKRWQRLDAKHLVTIILFTRMQYDRGFLPDGTQANGLPFDADAAAGSASRDFYRVVVSEMASSDWISILYQLKKEFRIFLRDVSVMPYSSPKKSKTSLQEEAENQPEFIIAGTPRTSDKGNILEAINLASLQYSKDYIDRDLVRTGISVIVISPGSGIFEVDYNMLKLTTDTLLGSGIGIDLVCLQPMPLHSVPLFKYRTPRLATETDIKLPLQRVVETDDSDLKDDFGPDDETPRQTFPNFGPSRHLKHRGSSSLAASPAKHQSWQSHPAPEPEPGEWSYAMPHWLDISFWTGSSDDIFGMEQVNKRGNPHTRSQRKSKGFSLRCRMYELQMMGVMENEMSNISLPYLQENPLYPWSLLAPIDDGTDRRPNEKDSFLISASSSPQDTRTSIHRSRVQNLDEQNTMHRAWMDSYDDHIFRPLPERQKAEERARKDRQQKELEARHVLRSNRFRYTPNESLLSASFNSQAESLGSSGRPPRSPSFLRGKEKSDPAREPSTKDIRSSRTTAQHRLSVASRTDFSTSPVGRDIRHLLLLDRANTTSRLPPRSVPADIKSEDEDSPTKENSDSRPHTPERGRGKDPVDGGSNRSANSSTNPRASKWLSRHISFSAFGFGPSKAAPSTEVTTSKVAPAALSKIAPATSVARKPSQLSVLSAALEGSDAHDHKKPSEPIQIQSTSKKSSAHDAPQSSLRIGSGTPKGRLEEKALSSSHTATDIKDPGSLFLLAGSKGLLDQVGPKLNLSTSGDRQEIPRTLSPTSSLAPWMVLVNPCNPRKNNLTIASQFRRWHHVFPRPLKASSIKWKSLCSPAAVPLTNDFFPNADQLATEYNESPYRIIQNDEEELYATPKSRENLIRELIAFRLAHGFQIIIGSSVAEFIGKPEQDIANIFAKDYMLEAGSSIFMSLGSTIHQLACVSVGEVEVKRFYRKPAAEILSVDRAKPPFLYKPLIKTALDGKYELQEFMLKNPRDEYNWNFIDSYLAGYEQDFSDTLRFWRARFVLIPVDIPPNPRRHLSMLAEDSDEEIRLEGIRKLTQIWQKWRYVPPEERQYQAVARMRKDPNPLAIEYQTRDPSAVVAAGPDGTILAEGTTDAFSTALFAGNESYNSSNYDIAKLAVDLQGEKGIPMTDRRWHFKLHLSCFLGFDLTTWLLQNFRDINTREEAVELGNEIMSKGLFHHVTRKHPFRDGNFFYQISSDYRAPRSETKSWLAGLSTRRSDKSSVPSTPSTEARPMSITSSTSIRSRPTTATSSSENSGEKTPTRIGSPRKQATLSNVMRIDVDPRKRSYRPEVVNLHYDRLHNPDNCYHIRIDWMNVTSKLIEDAINTWATSVEKYGLRLVELPIAEAASIGSSHPFRSPYMIRLACPPPKGQLQYFDSTSFGPQRQSDRFVYHKAILRKLGFVLDMESASSFPSDVDVTYSWGKPDYRYTQFIHKTGVLLAQITDDGDFLLLANRLCNNRGAFGIGLARSEGAPKSADSSEQQQQQQQQQQRREPTPIFALQNPTQNVRSPFASPLVRPVPDNALSAVALNMNQRIGVDKGFKTAEQIKDEMEALCLDERALRLFYADYATELSKSSQQQQQQRTAGASPSPRITAVSSPRMTPVLDSSIPSLGLPPGTSSSTGRDASPAPHLGNALIPHPWQAQTSSPGASSSASASASSAVDCGGGSGGGSGSGSGVTSSSANMSHSRTPTRSSESSDFSGGGSSAG